jgi:hypothetical protein
VKKYVWVIAMLVATLLGGCGHSTPDDELTARTIRPQTESGVTDVEVVDYQRDNGWVDEQRANRYVVRYKFNWQLKKPFFEVVLARAMEERKRISSADGTPNLFSLIFSPDDEGGASANSEPAGAHYANMMKTCHDCAVWLTTGDDNERKARQMCFSLAWGKLEQLGFKDRDQTGAKSARVSWATFIKTEKGWEAS